MKADASKSKELGDAVLKAVRESIAREEKLREQPPTDEKLQLVWPPWNACPEDFGPDDRISTLTGKSGDPRHHEELSSLKQRFNYLPVDPNGFHSTLNAAKCWHALKHYYRTTKALHSKVVKRHLAFAHEKEEGKSEVMHQASGRLAIFRAVRELHIRHRGLIHKRTPTLSDIAELNECYEAYRLAREGALMQLDRVVAAYPGAKKDAGPHIYIARLYALGLCSNRRFLLYICHEFPRLDSKLWAGFCKAFLVGKYGKNEAVSLRVWLADNVPVFRTFDWRPDDILEQAKRLCLSIPKGWADDGDKLSTAACKWGLDLNLKLGVRPPTFQEQLDRSRALLSPRPKLDRFLLAK